MSKKERFQPELPSLQRQWTKIITTSLVNNLNFDRDDDKARFFGSSETGVGRLVASFTIAIHWYTIG